MAGYTIESAVENAQLSRITVPTAATNSDLFNSIEQLRSAATRALGCLKQLDVPCVLWQGGGQPGDALLVLCMHKAGLTRVFKALYAQQRAIGIVVTSDIKAAVSLKPLAGHQLQIAHNVGLAKLLEAAGWQSVGQYTWLKSQRDVLLAVPGMPCTVACVRIAVPLVTPAPRAAPSAKTFGLQVQFAGSATFTPFSLVLTLKLRREPKEGDTWTHEQEWELLREHVFSSPAATRRACRVLYNVKCLLLPSLAPVYIKALRAQPQDEAAMRDRWQAYAPGLPLPQILPSTIVLDVSQDADTDSGDAGVWEVAAVCCWSLSGLQDVASSENAGPEQLSDSVMQQLKADLESDSFMLWGGQPLALKPAPTTYDGRSPTGVSSTEYVRPPLAPTAAQSLPASQLVSSQAQGGGTGWVAASQCQQPLPSSQHAVVGRHTEAASISTVAGGRDISADLFPPLPVISSTCWWATGRSCDQVYEAVMSSVTGHCSASGATSTVPPRVSAILSQRKKLRGQEQERWQGLQGVLNKLAETCTGEQSITVHGSGTAVTSTPKQPASKQLLSQRTLSLVKKPGLHSSLNTTARSQPVTLAKKAPLAPTGKLLPGKNKANDAVVPKAPVSKKPKAVEVVSQPTETEHPHQQPGTAGQTAGLLEIEEPMSQVVNNEVNMVGSQPVAPKAAAKIGNKAAKSQAQVTTTDGVVGQDHTKAPPARKRTKATDMDIAAVEAKVAAKAASGALSTLTVPEMQAWLRAHQLTVGGKKADLEARLAAAWNSINNTTA